MTVGGFALQPGIQYQFSPQWSVIAEMAVPLFSADKQFEKIKLLRNSVELKKLGRHNSRGSFIYTSLQVAYTFRKLTDRDSGTYWNKLYAEE